MLILNDVTPLNTTKREKTEEGYLVIRDSRIARTGIQPYLASALGTRFKDRPPFSKVNVYRPPEEVFDSGAMATFQNKPAVNDHPSTGLVNLDTVKNFAIGTVGEKVYQDGKYLVASTITITDSSAIKDIETGKCELSCGYTSELEFKKGLTDTGEPYEAIQRDIRGNHVAIVDQGRCGGSCRLTDKDDIPEKKEGSRMLITIDEVDYEISDLATAQAIKKVQNRLDKADSATSELQAKYDALTEENTKLIKQVEDNKELPEKVKKLEKEKADLEEKVPTADQLDQLVENRQDTRDKAIKIMGDSYDFANKDCEQIRKEVVKDKCDGVDVEKVDATYIKARFDALTDVAPKQEPDSYRSSMRNINNDSGDKPKTMEEARQAYIDSQNSYWKTNHRQAAK